MNHYLEGGKEGINACMYHTGVVVVIRLSLIISGAIWYPNTGNHASPNSTRPFTTATTPYRTIGIPCPLPTGL